MKAIRANGLKDRNGDPLTVLPWNKLTDGSEYTGMIHYPKGDKGENPNKKSKKGKSLCEACHVHDLLTLSRYGDDGQPHTTTAQLHVNNACMPVKILFDTGALQGNYLSEDVAGWMQRQGAVAKAESSRVCGAFNEIP